MSIVEHTTTRDTGLREERDQAEEDELTFGTRSPQVTTLDSFAREVVE